MPARNQRQSALERVTASKTGRAAEKNATPGVETLRERDLRQARLAAIVESSDDAIISKTLEGVITSWNRGAEALFGYSAAEAVGRSVTFIIPEDRLAEETDVLVRLRRGEKIDHFETVRQAKDGRLLDVSITVSHIRDGSGALVGASKVVRDITERKRNEIERQGWLEREQRARKQAEEERERLRQMEADLARINRVTTMGELTASLAHEIHQPIAAAVTSANACLRWLAHDPPDVESARQSATRAVREGTRAGEIIGRVRSIYKKSAPPVWEPLDVNDVAREMLALLREECGRHSVSARADLAPDLPAVRADRVELQQVFMNLMVNAIEAMEGGGELIVASRPDAAGVLISVSDTGAGLPAQEGGRIFDPFYTTKRGGTGMGLAICRSIVESHGGRVWATANAEAGAAFHFTLPSGLERSRQGQSGRRS